MKAAFRLFAKRLMAANEAALLKNLRDSIEPTEASCYLVGQALVMDANLQAAVALLEEKGWKEDSNGSDYAVMMKGQDSIRLDQTETSVTLHPYAHPDPHNTEASLTLEDPSDYLVDPDTDGRNYKHNDTRDTQIGDPRPSRMTNNTATPPSVGVLGKRLKANMTQNQWLAVFGDLFPDLAKEVRAGGAGGGGSGAVLPDPDPEYDAKIQRRLRRLHERRHGLDRDNSGVKDGLELLEEPGAPIENQETLDFADHDGPIFMADQPWGYNTDAPVGPESMFNVKIVQNEAEDVQDEADIEVPGDPRKTINADLQLQDPEDEADPLPIGSTDGTLSPNGYMTLMAVAKHIRAAVKPVMYHVTKLVNLDSIKETGLVPSKKSQNKFFKGPYLPNAIYFSSTLSSAKEWVKMLGDDKPAEMAKLCILKVDVQEWMSKIKQDPEFDPDAIDDGVKVDAYYLKGTKIPAANILKVFKGVGKNVSRDSAASDSFHFWDLMRSSKAELRKEMQRLSPTAHQQIAKWIKKVNKLPAYSKPAEDDRDRKSQVEYNRFKKNLKDLGYGNLL